MGALETGLPEEARLETLLGYHILDTPPEAVFDDLTGLAALIAEAPMAVMCLVDRDRLWFKSRIGLQEEELPRKGSFCENIIKNQPLFIVADALGDERFRDHPLVKAGVRFYAGAPIIVSEKHAIGDLSVLDTKPRRLSRAQQDSLIILSRAVAAQLELRREVKARKRRDRIMLSLLDDLKEGGKRLQELNFSLERRVSERTAEIGEALKELEGFAFNIAHNLRAPLRALNGFSQALLREHSAALDEKGRDYLGRILAASRRLDSMIADLLAYYRLPYEEFSVESVDLSSALDRVLLDMERELRDSNTRLTIERPLPRVLANEPLLRQALANLLSNAIKFTAPGVQPVIEIKAEVRGPRIRLWVKDNGIGIAPQHHERIFQVFERLNKMEDYPGDGIGLAIVRKGAERMGGRTGVESFLGQGSRFWIELRKADR